MARQATQRVTELIFSGKKLSDAMNEVYSWMLKAETRKIAANIREGTIHFNNFASEWEITLYIIVLKVR